MVLTYLMSPTMSKQFISIEGDKPFDWLRPLEFAPTLHEPPINTPSRVLRLPVCSDSL